MKKFLKIIYNLFKPLLIILYPINNKLFRSLLFDLSENEKYIAVKTKHESFIIHSKDKIISKHLFVTKQPTDFDKLLKIINITKNEYKITNIVDVGANIGTICIPACKRQIIKNAFAFEPDPKNYTLLQANIALNNLQNSIESFNFALGEKENESVNLLLSADNYGDNRVSSMQNIHKAEKITIKSKSLDSMNLNLEYKETLIWVDVQGYESFVLRGAKGVLSNKPLLAIEFAPEMMKENRSFQDLVSILEESKYKHFVDLNLKISKYEVLNKVNLERLYKKYDNNSSFTDLLIL